MFRFTVWVKMPSSSMLNDIDSCHSDSWSRGSIHMGCVSWWCDCEVNIFGVDCTSWSHLFCRDEPDQGSVKDEPPTPVVDLLPLSCASQVRRKVKTEETPRIRPSDLRNFVTMFVVFVLFAICWAPLNLIGLAVAIDPSHVAPRIPEWLFVVSYFMAYFNSCLNAIIYGLLNRNFRNEYKRIVTSVWVTRLFVTETSRAATDGRSLRSKQSPPPPLNNNESVRERTNKEWIYTLIHI